MTSGIDIDLPIGDLGRKLGPATAWTPGAAPVAVIVLALNEAHHLPGLLENLQGFAQEVFLVDSLSADDTVGIALRAGVHVVQRRFDGFGAQWNFALATLPICAPWTMKLDPDERLSDALKQELAAVLPKTLADGFEAPIRLWFLGRRLARVLRILRVWRTGRARFTTVAANEHALVQGRVEALRNEIEHHDSPSLEHWLTKQNRYSTAEAAMRFRGDDLAAAPRLFGSAMQRRMWLKRHFWKLPGRYALLFWHHYLVQGGWRAGRAGWIWAHLRSEVFRLQDYKWREMQLQGRVPPLVPTAPGEPDSRVRLYD